MSAAAHVVPATSDMLGDAALTLALALREDPWASWVVPEEDRRKRLVELQRIYLKRAHAYGQVLVAPSLGAIALLPAHARPSSRRVVDRMVSLHGDRVDRLRQAPPPDPTPGAWHVETFGVRPAHRGQGVCSALLVQALLEIKDLGVPLVAETSDPRTVRLLERYGFRVVQHTRIPDGPEVWSVRRDADG